MSNIYNSLVSTKTIGTSLQVENAFYNKTKACNMDFDQFEIQSKTLFSESLIWQFNRDFYQEKGISAWSDDTVPHHLTSNSSVGRTYAALIYAILKDLSSVENENEIVYILDLGAGHGRLGFHILKHLQSLISESVEKIPKYCYILSDIVHDNLTFLSNHPQLQDFFRDGVLDISYYDAIESEKLYLRKSKTTINPTELKQPLLAIANYFFDTIPSELFFIQNNVISDCFVSISSKENPVEMDPEGLIDNMNLTYHKSVSNLPLYKETLLNEILEDYREFKSDTHVFFPKKAMDCLTNLKALSKTGLVLLTMDKGFHELNSLKNKKEPDIVKHGSFSLWVNYHALSKYCTKKGGRVLFPSFSNFHLEIGCLLFLTSHESYLHTNLAYNDVVNNFGPDDYNSIKRLIYSNLSRLKLVELIAFYRLSAYDSTIFIKLLPRLKQVIKTITIKERRRLAETLNSVWEIYFNINEDFDLSYEIGGIFYDLGYYSEALNYFQYSVDLFGIKADVSYNQALCYYQLRQDKLFFKTLNIIKQLFPDFELLKNLENLDMT